ncbi:MAG TPA: cold shock domain-containing protein [Candidatus Aquilonibacter sp.]|nr:cold shock domain-containing protein [Candidatus Aquilonibacter sp.]
MSRLTGTVKWFNNAKGYGFLGRDDGGPDVFMHYSSIVSDGYKTLREGESVTFEIVAGAGGRPQADKVIPLRGEKYHQPSSPEQLSA